jgi:hypothetical protein
MRAIPVLDCAPLVRRGVIVLELDTPSPLLGVAIGMSAALVWKDGSREAVTVKGLGFASSTPEHAHIIVSAPDRHNFDDIERLEIEPRAAT